MAEAVARHLIDRGLLGKRPDVFVASAGVAAAAGDPVTPEAMEALRALGIDHDGTSKPLTPEMIRKADVVLGMTAGHIRTAAGMAPEARAKILQLDPGNDIEDPIGRDQEAYDALARRLMKLIRRRLVEALDHEDRTGMGSSRR